MNETDNSESIALIKTATCYPNNFYPTQHYPEFQSLKIHEHLNTQNNIYATIRTAFELLGFDSENFGTNHWNPLRDLIKPGDTVLVKPNMVKHYSTRKETTLEELITHPSIIVCVLDYVILALKDKGKIIIGDAPIQEADYEKILNHLKIKRLIEEYSEKTNINFEIVDFRKERSINRIYREIQRIPLSGDPKGYSIIDLGDDSSFIDITDQFKLFRLTNYDKEKMLKFHNKNKHSYIIANSVLEADVIISLPKLKSHRKAGMTGALKNLIGINGSKDCLPHYRKGSIEEGGDEYLNKSFRKRLLSNIDERRAQSKSSLLCFFYFLFKLLIYLTEKIFPYKTTFKEGSWYGNNTIPRTIVDMNYIIDFANKDGKIFDKNVKRNFLTITDAVIGGESEGPLHPTRKEIGFILVSKDFLANDIIASYLVGFDPNKIPTITYSLNSAINLSKISSPEEVKFVSNDPKLKDITNLKENKKSFYQPSSGWKGNIELEI